MAHRCEPGEIPVESDYLTVTLEGNRSEDGVGDQIARRVDLVADFAQQA